MRQINTFQIGPNAGNIGRLPDPTDFPEHCMCPRARFEVQVDVANTSGLAITLSNAQAVDIVQKVVGQWTMQFGAKDPETVDNAQTAANMRLLCQALGRDFIFNGKLLANYSELDADAITIANGATVTVTFEFVRPFVFEKFSKIDEWAPGTTQMRQLKCSFVRGGAFATAGLAQTGNAQVTYIPDTEPSDSDDWAPVPRLHRDDKDGMHHNGPAGGLLALLETSALGAATALNLVTLERAGDEPLVVAVTAKRVVRDSLMRTPLGGLNLNSLATCLYELEPKASMTDIPTAAAFKLTQHGNELAPMHTLWVYVPAVEAMYRDNIIGKNAPTPEHPTLRAVTRPAYDGQDVPGHVASISSVALVRPDHPKYELAPAREFSEQGAPRTVIPAATTAAIKGSSGGPTLVSRLTTEIKNLAKFIPGATSPLRKGSTADMLALASHVAPNDTARVQVSSALTRR